MQEIPVRFYNSYCTQEFGWSDWIAFNRSVICDWSTSRQWFLQWLVRQKWLVEMCNEMFVFKHGLSLYYTGLWQLVAVGRVTISKEVTRERLEIFIPLRFPSSQKIGLCCVLLWCKHVLRYFKCFFRQMQKCVKEYHLISNSLELCTDCNLCNRSLNITYATDHWILTYATGKR